MPTTRFHRQFSAGSKPTPDPYDRFLDDAGLFRKHTARDASSLFRVVSEHAYDTQDYHEQLRKDCVNYMIKHRHAYEHDIDGDFDEYTRRMAKVGTYGTLVELRAMGYMFKRNVLMYEPYDLGVWLVDENEYRDDAFWRVFYTNGPHFDTIFTKSYVVKAAFCQSIAYETLYKNVFKLPDIEYSVEMMLHSTNDLETDTILAQSEFEYDNDDDFATHIVFKDGRRFQLDRPENTECILDNPELCHFHNKDFDNVFKQVGDKYPNDQRIFQRYVKSSLPDKYNSCVRQLLNSAITPFPYKVAKALDPDIYRNIEFDSWNERRKEIKSRNKLQSIEIGTKCLAKLDDLPDNLFQCHIQHIDTETNSCIVFVEKLSEKRSVHVDHLHLPNVNEPLRRHTRYTAMHDKGHFDAYESEKRCDHHQYERQQQRHKSCADRSSSKYSFSSDFDDSGCDSVYKSCDLEAYTNLTNFQPALTSIQLIALPMHFSQSPNMTATSNHLPAGGANNRGKSAKGHQPIQVPAGVDVGQPNSAPVVMGPKNPSSVAMPASQAAIAPPSQMATGPPNVDKMPQVSVLKRDDSVAPPKNSADTKADAQPGHGHRGDARYQQNMSEQEAAVEPNMMVTGQPPHGPHGYVYLPNNAAMVQYAYPTQMGEINDQGFYGAPTEMAPAYYAAPPPGTVYQQAPATNVPPPNFATFSPSMGQVYPISMNAWSSFNSPIGHHHPGYGMPQAVPFAQPAPVPIQPIMRRELIQSTGRINFNSPASCLANGDDLPWNDKASTRFFYNLGVESFKQMVNANGVNYVMAMIDSAGNEPTPTELDAQNQLTAEFGQMTFDGSDPDAYHGKGQNGNYGFPPRKPKPHYKRSVGGSGPNDARSSLSRFQGTFQGYHGPAQNATARTGKPPKTHGNNPVNASNYDATPVKDPSLRLHGSHGGLASGGNGVIHLPPKRVAESAAPYVANENASGIVFGSNVPPFPYHHTFDVNDQNFVSPHAPPANAFPRMTPPVANARSTSMPNQWVQHNPPPMQQPSHIQQLTQHNMQQQSQLAHPVIGQHQPYSSSVNVQLNTSGKSTATSPSQ